MGEKRKKFFSNLFLELAISLLIAFVFISYIAQAFKVEGSSMEPLIKNNERVIVNKLTYKFSKIKRGDVVVFWYPYNPNKSFIKRVIGLPNEIIEIRDGNIFVNSKKLNEPYIKEQFKSHENMEPISIPSGFYFVLGDHRNSSNDSRVGWLVPEKYIYGKALLVYWPLGRFREI